MRKITKTIGIIPARYASVRFPGKPLVDIAGKTMIHRTYIQASAVPDFAAVYVATDDRRIYDAVQSFGGNVVMTSDKHRSGTDRCAEVVKILNDPKIDFAVNIQGDEPFIDPRQIRQVIEVIKGENRNTDAPLPPLATLAKRITVSDELFNENTVKVVFDDRLNALYFSRNPIPYIRGKAKKDWLTGHLFFKHIGLYAYRADILQKITQLPAGRLERAESLEQLRWLENGLKIRVGITEIESKGIDTPEDLENFLL